MRSICTSLALFIVIIVISPVFLPQIAAQSPEWIKNHTMDHGRYYEGLLDEPNGASTYEIVGFSAKLAGAPNHIPDRLSHGSRLFAWFYLPGEDAKIVNSASLSVTARQLETRTNYLMRTEPGAVKVAFDRWSNFNWSADNVILKSGVDPGDLGVTAHIAREGNPHLQKITPVIYCAECPAHSQIADYELLVRSIAYEFSSVSYAVVSSAAQKPHVCYFTIDHPCLSSRPKWHEPIEVGTLMRLEISPPPSAGWVEVKVTLIPADKSMHQDDFSIRFFHQPVFSRPA